MRPTNAASIALACIFTACNPPPSATEPAPSVSAAAPPSAIAAAPSSAVTAPSAKPTKSKEEAAAILAKADACLKDVACTAEQGDALYREANDAGAKVSCFRFYYGIGVTKDLPRARACFEREAAAIKCEGSSPGLVQAYLATMLVDGQGGPAEPARVKGVFAGCFEDATAKSLEEEADKRSLSSPLDFCEHIGGTTLTVGECHLIDGLRNEADRVALDRAVLSKLDAKGKQLAEKALAAHQAFLRKEGEAASDKYRDGSLYGNVLKSRMNKLDKERTARLLHLFDHALTAGADPAAAEKEIDKATKEATEGADARRRGVFTAARRAWAGYRDAEAALYAHALGAKLGKAEVERDVKAMLARAYAAEIEDAARP